MKFRRKVLHQLLSIAVASLINVSIAYAATTPASIYAFAPLKSTFVVRSKGWSDPAFGGKGWTHSSSWGNFSATAGQLIWITAEAADAGIHPGATVWFRGAEDTAPDNYVVDHFYQQGSDFIMLGAADDTTQVVVGDIVMKHVTHGYDQDNNTLIDKKLKGKTDNVPGKLVLYFKAPYTGKYMFVVGGVNPDATVNTALKYNIDVSLKFGAVPAPAAP